MSGKANMSKDELFIMSVLINAILLSVVLNYYDYYKKQQKNAGANK
jgi:hypothetical protein